MKHMLLLSAVLAGSLSAQTTYTFPSDHAAISNGASNTSFFPYSYGVSRMQAVYETWDLQIPYNTPIARIGVRQDGTNASTGYALQLEVLMGYTSNTVANFSSTYATNYASAMTSVFGPALFTLPNLTSAGGTTVWLNLTTPFHYDPPLGQNLLVEWRIAANSNGNAQFNYYIDRATFVSTVISGPAGCPHSGNNTALLTSQPTAVDNYWSMSLSRGPASSVFFLLQSFQPLVPAYQLTPFLPGISGACTGQLSLTSPLFIRTASTNTSGGYSWSVRVPNLRSLNDIYVSSQCALLDFFAPGGIVVSNGDQLQIGIEPAEAILYSHGSTTPTTGSLSRNYGVVTLFQ